MRRSRRRSIVRKRQRVDALAAAEGAFGATMLHGVTGSGKTDVYLAAAARAIARGGQVLILVPEINLTPQFERRVQGRLAGCARGDAA